MKAMCVVMNTIGAIVEIRPEKKKAGLYQLSYHANQEPVMMLVLNKPVK